MIASFRIVLVLGQKVPNLRLVGLSHLYHIPCVDLLVRCIMVFVHNGGICALNMVKFSIYRGIGLLGLLQEKIKFLLRLNHLLHQRLLLLLLALAFCLIICALLPPTSILLRPPMLLLVCSTFHFMIYYLLDLGSTLSYVPPYVAIYFVFDPEYIVRIW